MTEKEFEKKYHNQGGNAVNAYKRHRKRQYQEELEAVCDAVKAELLEECRDKMDGYLQHMDCVILMVLHRDFGFGAERLKRFYRAISRVHDEYKFYVADSDKSTLYDAPRDDNGNRVIRDDTWKLKEDLRRIGVDYDELVKEK